MYTRKAYSSRAGQSRINKEIVDLEKSLKAQNVEIGANEIVRTTAIAQKAMEELYQLSFVAQE